MNEAAEQALANFRHEQALASTHAKRADGWLSQFLYLVGKQPGSEAVPSGQSIRCIREWTKWLSENGPALRNDIAEATGVRLTERGTPHTFLWDEILADGPDDALPPNAIVRIPAAPKPGRGRPPMIFFLWSQRYDVHPLFGVGPTKPEPGTRNALHGVGDDAERFGGGMLFQIPAEPSFDPTADRSDFNEKLAAVLAEPVPEVQSNALLGVVPAPERYPTIVEWDDAWAQVFDSLAAAGAKPTEEVRASMVDTLPDGAEPNAALAIAYRQAVQRAQSGVTLTHENQDGTVWEEPPFQYPEATDG